MAEVKQAIREMRQAKLKQEAQGEMDRLHSEALELYRDWLWFGNDGECEEAPF